LSCDEAAGEFSGRHSYGKWFHGRFQEFDQPLGTDETRYAFQTRRHPLRRRPGPGCAPLKRVYEALCSIGVDALISIGGDDTLKTANKFKMYQDRLPAGSKKIPVVHLPKTIDNDYMGIDFTFGYFTAVDTLAAEIRNLLADAEANRKRTSSPRRWAAAPAGWLRRGNRRRSEPGDQRRRHHRQVSHDGRESPIRRRERIEVARDDEPRRSDPRIVKTMVARETKAKSSA
jgi:hypothetical protein